MVISFLIATLVLFVLSLGISLLVIAINAKNPDFKIGAQVVNVFISLIMITWNILAIISL
jgi:hypothetical protein